MENFSWSDRIHAAFSSCLCCLRPNESDHEPNTSDTLQGLLADADSLSLHSSIGGGERRHGVRKGLTKSISLWGWNLFGKPPVQLPEDPEDDLSGRRHRRPGTISSSTLDSDAAPLDVDRLEPRAMDAQAIAAAAAAAEERAQKEERRRRRRERRALKALAAQNLGAPASYEPEPIPSTFARVEAEDDEDAADLGGELYSRKTGTGGVSNGSDSRSRTSASLSNPDVAPYNHQFQALRNRSDSTSLTPASSRQKKSRSSKKSSSSTSQSLSLPSPIQSPSPFSAGFPVVDVVDPISPRAFEGYPDDIGDAHGFPSVGLGGVRSKTRDMGAFLAHRGDA